jgi:hypothetical protein
MALSGCGPQVRTVSQTAARPLLPMQARAATSAATQVVSLILNYRSDVRICVVATSLVPRGTWAPVNESEVSCALGNPAPSLVMQVSQADVDKKVWLKYQAITGDRGSSQMHAACFSLRANAVDLSSGSVAANPDVAGECTPPPTGLTLRVVLPAGRSFEQLNNGLELSARYHGEWKPYHIDKTPYTLPGPGLPDSITLFGDPDFEAAGWPVTTAGTLDLPLKPRNKAMVVVLQDRQDPRRTLPAAKVTVTVAGNSYTLVPSTPGRGTYQTRGEIVRGDKITFDITAPGYFDYHWNNVPYNGVFPSLIKLDPRTSTASVTPPASVTQPRSGLQAGPKTASASVAPPVGNRTPAAASRRASPAPTPTPTPAPPPGTRVWALRERGDSQIVEPWVRMSRSEVFSFAGFLSGLLTAANHPERAAESIAQTVSTATGATLGKQELLAGFMRHTFLLPFRDDTILRYTADQLQKKLLDEPVFQQQFQKEIGRSLERLSLAMAEQKADIQLTWDAEKGRWIKPPVEQIPVEKRWEVSAETQEYGWFPLSYFPGGVQ